MTHPEKQENWFKCKCKKIGQPEISQRGGKQKRQDVDWDQTGLNRNGQEPANKMSATDALAKQCKD